MGRWVLLVLLLAVFVPGAGAVIVELLQIAAHAVQQLSSHSCQGHVVTTVCGGR